jgi:hypothetical protein
MPVKKEVCYPSHFPVRQLQEGLDMASPIYVVERQMSKSKVFRTLPATAMVMLHDFLMKRKVKGGMILNNGSIEYCFSEAEKKGIPRETFNRNRQVLLERGFIDISHYGSGGKKGDKTLYAMSDRWERWGRDDFKHVEYQMDTRKGKGFSAVWKKKTSNVGGTPTSTTGET